MSMTLRQLLDALHEYDEDLLDIEVLIEDEYGATASIEGVVDANGVFIHPSKNFEDDTGLLDYKQVRTS